MFSSKKVTASICGHKTKLKGTVTSVLGETTTTDMSAQIVPQYCLDCLGKMAIRCAWCSNVIFIGDPITLYTTKDKVIPDGATIYDAETGTRVGCLGRDCADTGADRSGFWLPDPNNHGHGYVKRVMSPLEQVLAGHEMVIVSDIGDISEATPIN